MTELQPGDTIWKGDSYRHGGEEPEVIFDEEDEDPSMDEVFNDE